MIVGLQDLYDVSEAKQSAEMMAMMKSFQR